MLNLIISALSEFLKWEYATYIHFIMSIFDANEVLKVALNKITVAIILATYNFFLICGITGIIEEVIIKPVKKYLKLGEKND